MIDPASVKFLRDIRRYWVFQVGVLPIITTIYVPKGGSIELSEQAIRRHLETHKKRLNPPTDQGPRWLWKLAR